MEEADIMEMITGSEFAKKIKELALKNNKSIKKVLKDCGINRNYIYDLENKIKYPEMCIRDSLASSALYIKTKSS